MVAADGLAFIDGLYRLHVNTDTQYTARNLVVTSDDLVLTLAEGAAFLVEAEDGAVTGMVLMGRGAMEFAPTPEVEKRQVEIFSDSRTLIAPFETAFVRFNPSDLPNARRHGQPHPGPRRRPSAAEAGRGTLRGGGLEVLESQPRRSERRDVACHAAAR